MLRVGSANDALRSRAGWFARRRREEQFPESGVETGEEPRTPALPEQAARRRVRWHVGCSAGLMHHALFVIAPDDFRDEELFIPMQELERAGWSSTIASCDVGTCKGVHGGRATSTVALADVRVDDYDAIVFVGGPGARTYFDDPDAFRVSRSCEAAGKTLAAICIAPGILARAGVLRGKRATAFSSEGSELVEGGAHVESASVVRDGHIVTADGPRAAHEFAAAILHAATPHPAAATTQSLRAAKVVRPD